MMAWISCRKVAGLFCLYEEICTNRSEAGDDWKELSGELIMSPEFPSKANKEGHENHGGSTWESNPPGRFLIPPTSFED
jgi:hypothetical protein